MGTKFQLSPRIDAQLSQQMEGKIRDKPNLRSRKNENQNEKNVKENDKAIIEGTRKSKVPNEKGAEGPKDFVEQDSNDIATIRQSSDLDLAPHKQSLMTGPVNPCQSKDDVTYKNRAPVEMGLDIEKLVESLMKTEIIVPMSNLVGVSAAIQKEIKRQLTKSRVPVEDRTVEKPITMDKRPTIYLHEVNFDTIIVEEDESEEIRAGCITGGDPVLQFLAQNPGADLKQLKQGALTKPLRSIYCNINGVGQEECVLDGGSMIVSMNKKVAVQLGLVWDPTIRIDMESASNHVEQTLGVARNVTFDIGGLRLFLQVHILENPPYRVLLGRPFETLAATVVQTYEDGSSEVVVKCPNTKRVAVVPTYERGKTPEDLQKTKFQDF